LKAAKKRWGALALTVFAAAGCSRFGRQAKSTEVARPAAFAQGEARTEPAESIVLAEDEDFIVRVVAGEVTCSGALIQEDQVLTAHHCMSKRAKNGDMLAKDVTPQSAWSSVVIISRGAR
jgi:hypothetical protein